MTNQYDIFVSYKSEDVDFVRPVVELLMASGWRVWFAEYAIPLNERVRFREAFLSGIRGSSLAVLFTNNRYSLSEHCRLEARTILKEIEALRILQITCPDEQLTHSDFPDLSCIDDKNQLNGSNGINDIESAVAMIHDRISKRLASGPLKRRCRRPKLATPFPIANHSDGTWYSATVLGKIYRIGTQGWSQCEPEVGFHAPDDFVGPVFASKLCGCEARMRFGVWSDAADADKFPRSSTDDRELYDRLLEFAEWYSPRKGIRLRGAHLLHHSGLSHPSFTYWNKDCWTRRYSIVVRHANSAKNVEVSIHFELYGPFKKFCRVAILFDQIARSLQILE